MARKLIKLGTPKAMAWSGIYKGRRSLWVLSHAPAVEKGLGKAFFVKLRLVSLLERWKERAKSIVAPVQLTLALE